MLKLVMATTTDNLFDDGLIVPQCTYRPGSFSALMTIYESNYLKLEHVLNGLDWRAGAWVSGATEDCDLHLKLLSSERYTTTFKMTYWFEDTAGTAVADPDLIVRMYHDAGLAEGAGGRRHHHHCVLRKLSQGHAVELDRRWRTNVTLNKWLDYILHMGHSFQPSRSLESMR